MLPPPPNAEQIRRREFATVRRGYDPEQVRTYLASVADQMEVLERELNQLRLELTSAVAKDEQMTGTATASPLAPPAEDPYETLSKRFAGLIETADQEAEKALENARSEAKRALDEARSEADRIRVDAQAHAEEGRQEVADLLQRATTEADRVLSTLGERRRTLATQLEEMRAKLTAMAGDLATPLEEAAPVDAEDAEVAEARDEGAETPTDARHEDLSSNEEEPLQIGDLEPLDVGLEERHE
jgi:DivIVA domain-containing protein